MVRAEAMLEATVVRAGIDEVRSAQLLHAAQALERRRIDEGDRPRLERYGAVDGVAQGDVRDGRPIGGAVLAGMGRRLVRGR
ncbi:MAG: hypothetical protein LC620_03215 [Halobacteriales archaeon]|nr:hypothetical protein [Halobacteriales archaeon]